MHTPGKGIAQSALPYKRSVPSVSSSSSFITYIPVQTESRCFNKISEIDILPCIFVKTFVIW